MADTVELERGLCYYFEQQSEFERKGLSVEKQVAIGFTAGLEIGRAEVKAQVALIFKPDVGNEWP
jgi:hypothetical protein